MQIECYYALGMLLGSSLGLLCFYYPKIKKKILYRYGVKHKAKIINAKYNPYERGTPGYYLEIEFINNRGKRKILHTPPYFDDPNCYLGNAYCSVYEWKGFYVEGDFRLREEVDHLEWYAPIPTEKKFFIWRSRRCLCYNWKFDYGYIF